MTKAKRLFYENAAKRFAASTVMYRVDSVVHLENADDILFWKQVLMKYRPGKYIFKTATVNENGNLTTGCTQCLKYRDYLSQRFFVCIDSDLRYLMGENLSAAKGILQTYTYSWENHCAYAPRLQKAFKDAMGEKTDFDFERFLARYSRLLYRPFILMLYQERNGYRDFNREDFRRSISIQYRTGYDENDAEEFFLQLQANLDEAMGRAADDPEFDFRTEAERYSKLGVREENVYLYVRGHCIYNTLVSFGNKFCSSSGINFEREILQASFAFGEYLEIEEIRSDIQVLQARLK